MDSNNSVGGQAHSKEGTLEVEVSSWQEFSERVINLRSKRGYIWRGQRRDSDNNKPLFLTSSFDRTVLIESQQIRDELLGRHLKEFKNEMERCHPNVLPEATDDIWALGQHYGLKTPLLDWSLSPYIAAYFAFEKPPGPADVYRYVYALNRSVTRLLSKLETEGEIRKDRVVGVVEELTHQSPRFLAQKGVFTRVLEGRSIETAVGAFSKQRPKEVLLVKFKIPTRDRDECLRHLNLMDINHTRLLLDLRDVTDRCNQRLERNTMNTTKYVYWQDEQMWLGYLEEFPDYRTQGNTKEELEANLKDIYEELTGGSIPCVRRVDRLEVA